MFLGTGNSKALLVKTLRYQFPDQCVDMNVNWNAGGTQRLYADEKSIQACFKRSSEIAIIPMNVWTGNNYMENHVCALVYDKRLNTVEYYDPHGFTMEQFHPDVLHEKLAEFFSKLGVNYLYPYENCPYFGPQKKYGKYGEEDVGTCTLWRFLYTYLRLKIPDANRQEIEDYMNGLIRYNNSVVATLRGLNSLQEEFTEKYIIANGDEKLQEDIIHAFAGYVSQLDMIRYANSSTIKLQGSVNMEKVWERICEMRIRLPPTNVHTKKIIYDVLERELFTDANPLYSFPIYLKVFTDTSTMRNGLLYEAEMYTQILPTLCRPNFLGIRKCGDVTISAFERTSDAITLKQFLHSADAEMVRPIVFMLFAFFLQLEQTHSMYNGYVPNIRIKRIPPRKITYSIRGNTYVVPIQDFPYLIDWEYSESVMLGTNRQIVKIPSPFVRPGFQPWKDFMSFVTYVYHTLPSSGKMFKKMGVPLIPEIPTATYSGTVNDRPNDLFSITKAELGKIENTYAKIPFERIWITTDSENTYIPGTTDGQLAVTELGMPATAEILTYFDHYYGKSGEGRNPDVIIN